MRSKEQICSREKLISGAFVAYLHVSISRHFASGHIQQSCDSTKKA